MTNEEILKSITSSLKKHEDILNSILEQLKKNSNMYKEYVIERDSIDSKYRGALEKTEEYSDQIEADRKAEHSAYMKSMRTAQIANYFRIISSLCLVGLVLYVLLFGVKGIYE